MQPLHGHRMCGLHLQRMSLLLRRIIVDKKHSSARNNQTALGGLFCCLSLVVMLISPLFPMTLFSFPAISGLLLLIVAIETTVLLALTGYIAVSLLSFLLLIRPESTILFALFFGYYPTVSFYIKNKFPRPFCILIKLFLINTCFLLLYCFLENWFIFHQMFIFFQAFLSF
jgi:hypothetical protein